MSSMSFNFSDHGASVNVHLHTGQPGVDFQASVLEMGDNDRPPRAYLTWTEWKPAAIGDLGFRKEAALFIDRAGVIALQNSLATLMVELDNAEIVRHMENQQHHEEAQPGGVAPPT